MQAKIAALEAKLKESEEDTIEDKVSKAITAATMAIASEDAPTKPDSANLYHAQAVNQLRSIL